MQVSKPRKKVIIKNLVWFLVCVSIGWYLKARMTPAFNMAGMQQGTPYVLNRKTLPALTAILPTLRQLTA